ncbi:MAG: universal stress protein [Desulfobacteraceae bacterium]|nr:universal stress protein [Desulfobacteraceae bacterium]
MDISMILIPVDFSDCALIGLNYAKELTKKWQAELILIHVVDAKSTKYIANYLKEPIEKIKERLINQAKQNMRQFIKQNASKELIKNTIVCYGRPFQEIAIKARELQVDIILMGGYGSLGMGQIDEIFFGSTVEKVARLLPCPVLCVPMGWTNVKT